MKNDLPKAPRRAVQFAEKSSWLLLAACVGIFLALRARWIGHLLVWDEAMALCTTRSFSAGSDDQFAAWLWRHPPLHSLLLLVLRPMQAGFAERAEILSVAIGAVNLLLLFAVNRRVFGNVVGLWSAFLVALLPGSAFFDVWIKQDHLVVTFGLLALLSMLSRRILLSAVWLGLALLSKGTAAFYSLAIFLLWLGHACGKRTLKDIAWLVGISALTCGWWYLGVLAKAPAPGGADTFRFALNSQAFWQGDWTFYFRQLPAQLGWLCLALVGAGAGLLVRALKISAFHPGDCPRVWKAWPLCLLGPALLLISFVPNKVPWIVIALFPAWATLAAFGVAEGLSILEERFNWEPLWRRHACAVAGVAISVAATVPLKDYESMLRRLAESQWRGAANSKAAAEALNQNINDGDRVLLTSFHYWKGVPPGLPDPIFTCYLAKKPSLLLRSHRRTFEEAVADIREHRLDWALLSPEPGDAASALFGGFNKEFGLQPHQTPGAWLFRTAELHRNPKRFSQAGQSERVR